MTLHYRETDPISGRWTANTSGVKLSSFQGDENIYTLSQAIAAVAATVTPSRSVASIGFNTGTNELTFNMSDSTMEGPFVIDVAKFHGREAWAPSTTYSNNETFYINGTVYLVEFPHTSALTFDAGANDGMGHNYYSVMVPNPGNALPTGGAVGSKLTKTTSSDFACTWSFEQASLVVFTASTDSALVSNNVADVVEELEILIHTTVNAIVFDAADITFTPSTDSDLISTNVADALAEVENNIPDVSGFALLVSPTFTGTPAAPTPSPGDNDTSIATTAFVTAAIADVPVLVSLTIAASDEGTALTTGTAKVTFRMPHAMSLTAVRASLSTAQASGSILTVDINESGTTILSTNLTIDNTEKTSTTAATPAVISDASLADDAEITIDIDQVGDGTAKGLKIALIGTR